MTILTLAACASHPQLTRSKDHIVVPLAVNKDLKQLTNEGSNSQPSFSVDGSKLLYASGRRLDHKQTQIYELNLKSHKERRMTFQGADNYFPMFATQKSYIIYSSATDELKENPPWISEKLNGKKANPFAGPEIYKEPLEIYLHKVNGLDIRRLTRSRGFDGEARTADKKHLIYTRHVGSSLELMSLNLKTRQSHRLKGFPKNAAHPAVAPNGKDLAWIVYGKDFQTSQLWIRTGKNKKQLLTNFDALIKDPSWAPDGRSLMFSMNQPDPKNFNLFSVSADGTCLTQWTSDPADDVEPQISPKADIFVFASNRSGIWQIYQRNWTKGGPCASPATPAKLK